MLKKIIKLLAMPITNEHFNTMVLNYPTKHLFGEYYLMRDDAYGVMGPSLWGIVRREN